MLGIESCHSVCFPNQQPTRHRPLAFGIHAYRWSFGFGHTDTDLVRERRDFPGLLAFAYQYTRVNAAIHRATADLAKSNCEGKHNYQA